MAKGRWALLELGRQRPDVIDSGVLNWNAEKFGDDDGRVKTKLSLATQVRPAPALSRSQCEPWCLLQAPPLAQLAA